MDWTGQHIDVLARLRELALPPTNNDEAVMRESRAAEELREFEEGVLAEALFQSEQEAFAKALTIACGESPVKFQVYAIGYTRAGESEVTLEAELPARGGEAAKGRSISGAWKAAVPLFSFLVLEANNSGEEHSKHIITKSREDFEALHELLQSHVRQGGSGTAAAATPPPAAKSLPLPKLPGRKLLNANSHTHLQKRLGRYQEYLGDLVRNPATASSSALHTFLGEASNSAPLSRRPATCTPEAQTLLQHVATPRALSSPSLPSPNAPLPRPPSHAHQILQDIGQAILPALSPPPPTPAPHQHLSPTSASASLAQEAAASGDLRESLIGAGTHVTCFTGAKVQILTLKAQTRLAYAAAGPPAAGACSTWGLQGLRVLQVLQGRT
jgi:hypothetical protein